MLTPLPGGLRVVRTLRARRADVFDAWVDPDRLRTWWGPPGIEVAALEADLRVGGSYRIAMQAPDGERRVLVWTFREIARPERLVYEWRWESGPDVAAPSLVTVAFHEAGAHTEIELTHTGIDDEAIRARHGPGWLACLEELDRTLNRMV
jgi:uncharacterized protein YndB with AHSA1/START domain